MVNLVFVFIGALHRLAELLFQKVASQHGQMIVNREVSAICNSNVEVASV